MADEPLDAIGDMLDSGVAFWRRWRLAFWLAFALITILTVL